MLIRVSAAYTWCLSIKYCWVDNDRLNWIECRSQTIRLHLFSKQIHKTKKKQCKIVTAIDTESIATCMQCVAYIGWANSYSNKKTRVSPDHKFHCFPFYVCRKGLTAVNNKNYRMAHPDFAQIWYISLPLVDNLQCEYHP